MKIPTSPFLFKIIKRAFWIFSTFMLLISIFITSNIQEMATPQRPPNPAKSAWFLLWIQELMSYSKMLIYPVLGLFLLFLFLPWISGYKLKKTDENAIFASWFSKELKWISILILVISILILALTLFAGFFRGENWSFTW